VHHLVLLGSFAERANPSIADGTTPGIPFLLIERVYDGRWSESKGTRLGIYFCCFAPMIYPANPEKTAARHIGMRVQARFVAGIARFTKAVRITPITSPMTHERIARNNETLFTLASHATSRSANSSTE
jgi:hypothetical protein